MTIETAPSRTTVTREPGAHALVEIAYGLANGARTLVPSATAAVVVAIGSEWQLLAKAGPLEIADSWPVAVANQVRDSDLPQQHDGYLLAPFSAIGLHALLIVVAAPGEQMPRRTHALLQPLLDAGGILLDRALTVQERDRAVRRVVRLCRHEEVPGSPHPSRGRTRRRIAVAGRDGTLPRPVGSLRGLLVEPAPRAHRLRPRSAERRQDAGL